MALAAVRDLREVRRLETPEDVAAFEQDLLTGFVLARASAGMADSTVKADTGPARRAAAALRAAQLGGQQQAGRG